MTIAVLPVPRARSRGFGIVRLDEAGRVVGFVEKPQTRRGNSLRCARRREWIESRGIRLPRAAIPGQHGHLPVSPQSPVRSAQRPAAGHRFRQGNLSAQPPHAPRPGPPVSTATGKTSAPSSRITRLISPWPATTPPFDFHSPEGVIYTRMRFLPASRIDGACTAAHASSATAASFRRGPSWRHCSLGVRSRIGRDVRHPRHGHHRRRPF